MTTQRLWRPLLALAPTLVCALFVLSWGAAAVAAPASGTVTADRLNVRSRPGFSGEVITQLARGQRVVVLGNETLSKPASGEPSAWVKIELPPSATAWVAAEYVDADSKTVTADVLNVRAGPSYDHGIVARAQRGTRVKVRGEIREGWIEIEAPAGAWGFIPLQYVAMGPGAEDAAPAGATPELASPTPPPSIPASPSPSGAEGAVAAGPAVTPVDAPPTSTPAGEGTAAAAPSPEASGTVPVARALPEPTPVEPAAPAASVPPAEPSPAAAESALSEEERAELAWRAQFAAPAVAEPVSAQGVGSPETGTEVMGAPVAESPEPEAPAGTSAEALERVPKSIREVVGSSPGRWVRREGVVVRPVNFAAPSFYALRARDRGRTVNFLFTSRAEPISWPEYRGRVVIITGREYLDRRSYWQGIPLLDIETIEAVR